MTTNPKEEKYRRQATVHALEKLRDGKPCTRDGLFPGPEKNWHRCILTRLIEQKIIARDKENKGFNSKNWYKLVDRASVDRILDSDGELTTLIWPSVRPMIVPPPNVEEPLASAGATDSVIPSDDGAALLEPGQDGEDEPTRQQMLEVMFKMLPAIMQNMIYLRERLEAIEAKLGGTARAALVSHDDINTIRGSVEMIESEVHELLTLWKS